jgi:hypothetical protein
LICIQEMLFTNEVAIPHPDLSKLWLRAVLYLLSAVIFCLLEVEQKLDLPKVAPERLYMILHLFNLSMQVIGLAD